MFATALKILGALVGILGLAVSLLFSQEILSPQITRWLLPSIYGVEAIVAAHLCAAFVAALPFGLAFGAIAESRVAALLFSTVAKLPVFLLYANLGGLKGIFWWTELLQYGLFVALFCSLAAVGNWLCARFPRRTRTISGAVAFTILLAVFITAPFYGM